MTNSHNPDKRCFEKEYQAWKTDPNYPGKKNTNGKILLPRMERLMKIIRHFDGKIPYDVLSDQNRMWEKLEPEKTNKINFRYTIFMAVYAGYLLMKDDCLRPNYQQIDEWWAARKNKG